MKRTMNRTLAAFLAVGTLLIGGCQSVHDGLKAEIVSDGKPSRPQAKAAESVAVPDLDERRNDTQFLSRIDMLQKENFELRAKLKTAESERDEAVNLRSAAQQNETALADLIDEYRTSLASAADREKKLKARLLRTELQSVQYQQKIAEMKIQNLTRGESK